VAGDRGMFGFDRLKDALRRSAPNDTRSVISTVMKELTSYGKTQDDDVTMLVVKYNGSATNDNGRKAESSRAQA
jgi:serine phosphatase RsbU (regulator of sigma subunit)